MTKNDVGGHQANGAQHLKAEAALQPDIQHHHIGLRGQDAVNRALRGVGLTHDVYRAALQYRDDAIADQYRVIGKKNFDKRFGAGHVATVAGIAAEQCR